MIIENAFLKLPELLTSNYDHGDTFEATVVHYLATAIHMELNSRNIPRPFEHVATEKPFPTKAIDGKAIRCDLFVNLKGAVLMGTRIELYGTRELNWVEAKVYMGSSRASSTPPKTSHAGKILRDLLRLCLLPEELQGRMRQNGRYMLIVCDSHPSEYLPLKNRGWLSTLFKEKDPVLEIPLSNEPDTLRSAIGSSFIQNPDLKLIVKLHSLAFEPEGTTPSPVFWGYLFRVSSFTIRLADNEITFVDPSAAPWDENLNSRLQLIRTEFIRRMGSASND
jgi:hypothetical protein